MSLTKVCLQLLGIGMKSPDPLFDPGTVETRFLLVQDSARPHMARACRQFLVEEDINAVNWSSHSLDLNPIKQLWDIMYRRIRQRAAAPQTVQELTNALTQVWRKISQDTIPQLIRSM